MAFIDKSINDKHLNLGKLIPLSLNIANNPSLVSVKEAGQQVANDLDDAYYSIESGLHDFKKYLEETRKAEAIQQVNLLSKQSFDSITDIKTVKHIDKRPLI